MGRKRNPDRFSTIEVDTLSSTSTTSSDTYVMDEVSGLEDSLEMLIDALYEKRASTREISCLKLVEALESNVLLQFVENKYLTLSHLFINSVKKGSTKEVCLASRALGLLAITVGAANSMHEIMEETISKFSSPLISGSDSLKRASLVDCLALVTFVGSNDADEIEKSMGILWEVINPKARADAAKKSPPSLIATAISAWSFLLTTTRDFRIDPKNWQEPLPYLSTLLLKDDRAVRMAAGEAIALIFEIGRLNEFSREENNFNNSDDVSKSKRLTYVESFRGKILDQVRDLAAEAAGKGATKKDLNSQRNFFQHVLDFLETSDFREITVKMPAKFGILCVSSWTQSIQLNFIKHFLGKGFNTHIEDNGYFHEVFDFVLERKSTLSYEKKVISSALAAGDKERTQKLNKDRMLSKARKEGHFSVTAENT